MCDQASHLANIPHGRSLASVFEFRISDLSRISVFGFRASSIVNPLDEEWDLLTKNYRYDREAIAEILWYGPDVVVLEPQSLRSNIVSILEGRI